MATCRARSVRRPAATSTPAAPMPRSAAGSRRLSPRQSDRDILSPVTCGDPHSNRKAQTMSKSTTYTSIGVTIEGRVTTIEIQRPPNNFFDRLLIEEIARACEAADADPEIRAVVLAAQGKAFCAGADF